MSNDRVLVSDNEGNWYLIPVVVEKDFVVYLDTGDYEELKATFHLFQIDGPDHILIKDFQFRD